jgi:hypothetical protein
MNIEIEIERDNVTVAEFLSYIKRRCAQKGADFIDIDRSYFEDPTHNSYRSYYVKDGMKYVTDGKAHYNRLLDRMEMGFICTEREPDTMAEAETSREFPHDIQTYIRCLDGSVYNEICEFTFDDEKRGHGYFYLLNKDADEKHQDTAERVSA